MIATLWQNDTESRLHKCWETEPAIKKRSYRLAVSRYSGAGLRGREDVVQVEALRGRGV